MFDFMGNSGNQNGGCGDPNCPICSGKLPGILGLLLGKGSPLQGMKAHVISPNTLSDLPPEILRELFLSIFGGIEESFELEFPLKNYEKVKKLLSVKNSIERFHKLSKEIKKSIEVFKKIFNGDSDAFEELPKAGKIQLEMLAEEFFDFITMELLVSLKKNIENAKDPDELESNLHILLDEANKISEDMRRKGAFKWIVEELAAGEMGFVNPEIKDFFEKFKELALNFPGERLKKELTWLEQEKTKIISEHPEFDKLSKPPTMRITKKHISEAVKIFANM